MDHSAARRAVEFEERFARAQASQVVEYDWGYGLLQTEFANSWHHNRLVVTAPVSSSEAMAAADDLLSAAEHRMVQVTDDAVGAALAPDFAAAGYGTHELILTMVLDGTPPPRRHGLVRQLDFGTLRPALIREWSEQYPTETPDKIAVLADRLTLYSRGADVAFLGVLDGSGGVAAHADLYQKDGIAQFENLVTRPEHRRKGYASALLAAAVHLAREDGADLVFLTAESTDWPRAWYARRGFTEVATSHLFVREPSR